MGLIILPYFIGLIFILVMTLKFIIKEIKIKKNLSNGFFVALLISVFLLLMLNISYSYSTSVYVFGPAFFIPLITIIIPYFLGKSFNLVKNESVRSFSFPLLLSILISVLLMIIFYKYLDVIERFKLDVYH